MVDAASSAGVAQWQSNGFVSRCSTEVQAEEWRPISGTSYEVSSAGRVRSQAHRAPRALADVAGMFGRAFRAAIAARKAGQ